MIKGPSILKGEVLISGSKNAALPILASTLLFDKSVIIKDLSTSNQEKITLDSVQKYMKSLPL